MITVACYHDATCSSKDYLCTPDGKSYMIFHSVESAKLFLKTSKNYSDEDLELFLYEEVPEEAIKNFSTPN